MKTRPPKKGEGRGKSKALSYYNAVEKRMHQLKQDLGNAVVEDSKH